MMKTIEIKDSTRYKLAKFGNMLSTWDDVINNLLDHAERCDLYWNEKQ